MKYGENFERESVPEWSLHNIDYNYLKHFIKVNTTRHESIAIAIPGQPDTRLAKAEDELYNELCAQHDRAGLFVSAKADEITRRLQHLSQQVRRLISRCTSDTLPLKQQRRFRRLEREVISCGEDIKGLQRFVNAQVMAFRKLLKKYRKWTGSTTLSGHFKEDVLGQPKSFTRKDLRPLGRTYEELLATIRDSAPMSLPPSPALTNSGSDEPDSAKQSLRRATISPARPQTSSSFSNEQGRYWNEYDNGSENGDAGDEYVIYINPDEEADYGADLKSLLNTLTAPFTKARSWVKVRRRERQSLLGGAPGSGSTYGATTTDSAAGSPSGAGGSYFVQAPYGRGGRGCAPFDSDVEDDADRDSETAGGYASSEEFPLGYEAHYAALPSINDQHMALYKDRLVHMVTGGLFAMAYLLLGIATVLMLTGRHRLRVEVDAGVTVGSVVSLGCACTGLALTMARWDYLGVGSQVIVTAAFAVVCVANGMLLVLVMGNSSL